MILFSQLLLESSTAEKAKKLGLKYKGHGYWTLGKSGKSVAQTVDGKLKFLVPKSQLKLKGVKPKAPVPGAKPAKKAIPNKITSKMPVANKAVLKKPNKNTPLQKFPWISKKDILIGHNDSEINYNSHMYTSMGHNKVKSTANIYAVVMKQQLEVLRKKSPADRLHLQAIVKDWVDSSQYQKPEKYKKVRNSALNKLLTTGNDGKPVMVPSLEGKPIYRGMRFNKESVRKKFLDYFTKNLGKKITLDPSGFSIDPKTARGFSESSYFDNSVMVRLHPDENGMFSGVFCPRMGTEYGVDKTFTDELSNIFGTPDQRQKIDKIVSFSEKIVPYIDPYGYEKIRRGDFDKFIETVPKPVAKAMQSALKWRLQHRDHPDDTLYYSKSEFVEELSRKLHAKAIISKMPKSLKDVIEHTGFDSEVPNDQFTDELEVIVNGNSELTVVGIHKVTNGAWKGTVIDLVHGAVKKNLSESYNPNDMMNSTHGQIEDPSKEIVNQEMNKSIHDVPKPPKKTGFGTAVDKTGNPVPRTRGF